MSLDSFPSRSNENLNEDMFLHGFSNEQKEFLKDLGVQSQSDMDLLFAKMPEAKIDFDNLTKESQILEEKVADNREKAADNREKAADNYIEERKILTTEVAETQVRSLDGKMITPENMEQMLGQLDNVKLALGAAKVGKQEITLTKHKLGPLNELQDPIAEISLDLASNTFKETIGMSGHNTLYERIFHAAFGGASAEEMQKVLDPAANTPAKLNEIVSTKLGRTATGELDLRTVRVIEMWAAATGRQIGQLETRGLFAEGKPAEEAIGDFVELNRAMILADSEIDPKQIRWPGVEDTPNAANPETRSANPVLAAAHAEVINTQTTTAKLAGGLVSDRLVAA